MTAPARTPPRMPTRPGLLAGALGLVCGVLVSFVGSLVVGTAIEWIGMHWWWRDQGVEHSRAMVREDLDHLRAYRYSLLTDDTVLFAAGWAVLANHAARSLGIERAIAAGRSRALDADAHPARRALAQGLRDAAPYLHAMVHVWQDALIRLAIAVLALPAFVLAFVIGLVDGLARRDIRKWSGGRESSFVYHHAKRLLWPAFTGGFFVYLTWPAGGFNPAWMVLPFCAAAAWTVSLMAATFKKYL